MAVASVKEIRLSELDVELLRAIPTDILRQLQSKNNNPRLQFGTKSGHPKIGDFYDDHKLSFYAEGAGYLRIDTKTGDVAFFKSQREAPLITSNLLCVLRKPDLTGKLSAIPESMSEEGEDWMPSNIDEKPELSIPHNAKIMRDAVDSRRLRNASQWIENPRYKPGSSKENQHIEVRDRGPFHPKTATDEALAKTKLMDLATLPPGHPAAAYIDKLFETSVSMDENAEHIDNMKAVKANYALGEQLANQLANNGKPKAVITYEKAGSDVSPAIAALPVAKIGKDVDVYLSDDHDAALNSQSAFETLEAWSKTNPEVSDFKHELEVRTPRHFRSVSFTYAGQKIRVAYFIIDQESDPEEGLWSKNEIPELRPDLALVNDPFISMDRLHDTELNLLLHKQWPRDVRPRFVATKDAFTQKANQDPLYRYELIPAGLRMPYAYGCNNTDMYLGTSFGGRPISRELGTNKQPGVLLIDTENEPFFAAYWSPKGIAFRERLIAQFNADKKAGRDSPLWRRGDKTNIIENLIVSAGNPKDAYSNRELLPQMLEYLSIALEQTPRDDTNRRDALALMAVRILHLISTYHVTFDPRVAYKRDAIIKGALEKMPLNLSEAIDQAYRRGMLHLKQDQDAVDATQRMKDKDLFNESDWKSLLINPPAFPKFNKQTQGFTQDPKAVKFAEAQSTVINSMLKSVLGFSSTAYPQMETEDVKGKAAACQSFDAVKDTQNLTQRQQTPQPDALTGLRKTYSYKNVPLFSPGVLNPDSRMGFVGGGVGFHLSTQPQVAFSGVTAEIQVGGRFHFGGIGRAELQVSGGGGYTTANATFTDATGQASLQNYRLFQGYGQAQGGLGLGYGRFGFYAGAAVKITAEGNQFRSAATETNSGSDAGWAFQSRLTADFYGRAVVDLNERFYLGVTVSGSVGQKALTSRITDAINKTSATLETPSSIQLGFSVGGTYGSKQPNRIPIVERYTED